MQPSCRRHRRCVARLHFRGGGSGGPPGEFTSIPRRSRPPAGGETYVAQIVRCGAKSAFFYFFNVWLRVCESLHRVRALRYKGRLAGRRRAPPGGGGETRLVRKYARARAITAPAHARVHVPRVLAVVH